MTEQLEAAGPVKVAITFGVQYGLPPNSEHPAFPNIDVSKGWLVIEAPTREDARKLASLICGESAPGLGRWAFDYDYDEFVADPSTPRFFPLGEIGRATLRVELNEELRGVRGIG